ncbi:MAG TPA: aminotransferase class I/II-fold pyridoxal phosphate-dependent enzyme, partial [Candidatus Angelobacter sp.]|nr:aminotransferase class I/II-fold pyridoxal phosphate-dependent enzyme [Candidatus Angelobacter sp.]
MAQNKSANGKKRNEKKIGFATTSIHVGQEPDPSTGAVAVPIFATSTYVQEELGKHKGYEYARVSNPTRTRLETNLAALEGGSSAHVYASGMAAVTAITQCFLKQGDHLLCGHNVYGGVPRFFNQVVANYGVEFSYVNTSDLDAVKKAMRKNTRIIWIETPTNPLMVLTDIKEIAKIAHASGAELVV